MPPPLLASSSPSRRIFSRPFRATWTILESMSVSRSHRGFIQPSSTRCLKGRVHTQKITYITHSKQATVIKWALLWGGAHLICSAEPPEVALVMAQAASFLVRNSATCRIVMRGGSRPASITIWGGRRKMLVRCRNDQVHILGYCMR